MNILNDIFASCREVHTEEGEQGVMKLLDERERLRRKWNMNFKSALILHGKRQRPQVYMTIEAPDETSLLELKEEAKSNGAFSLRVSFEKRVRSVYLPGNLIPSVMFRPTSFHVRFFLPVLYDKHQIK